MSRGAILFAATFNQLLMCQALVRAIADRYDHVRIVWFGRDPLARFPELQVTDRPRVRWLDFHGNARFKLWKAGGRSLVRAVRERARAELQTDAAATEVFLGNDNQLFPQVVLRELGLGWPDVTLYEEGVGFYVGSPRVLEKAAVNLLLRLRGHPYGEFYRDFSRNPRIRRLACNHPSLLQRTGVDVIDTSADYRAVAHDVARKIGGSRAERPAVDCVYISSNYSGARMMTERQELRLLEDLLRALRQRVADPVHIAFHPSESAAKRSAVAELGFLPLDLERPFEVEYLLRDYRNVVSIRSSVMINLPVVGVAPDSRIRVVRTERGPVARLYRAPVARVFDGLVRQHHSVDYFDPYAG